MTCVRTDLPGSFFSRRNVFLSLIFRVLQEKMIRQKPSSFEDTEGKMDLPQEMETAQ